jgi:hypothetical protein
MGLVILRARWWSAVARRMAIAPGQLVDPAGFALHVRPDVGRHFESYTERHTWLYTDNRDAVALDAFHRHHAVVELAIRDHKEAAGSITSPPGTSSPTAPGSAARCWPTTSSAGPPRSATPVRPRELVVARSVRTHLIAVPGCLVNRSGTARPRNCPGRSCSPGDSSACATCSRCQSDCLPKRAGAPAITIDPGADIPGHLVRGPRAP